jgi:AraC family transcriptional regulator
MTDPIEAAVARAISTIRADFADDITVDDLARAALLSKFHFTRVFRRTTGVSPARFLAAVRLQEAKRLLRSTSLNIVDVSRLVGYHSVGTFSSRFTRSVGLSPTAYRQLGGRAPRFPMPPADADFGGVRGHLWSPRNQSGCIYLGLFPSRIPEGPPVRCLVMERSGAFTLTDVPVGTYHLLCHTSAPDGVTDRDVQARVAVGRAGPLTVSPHQVTAVNVHLKPSCALDPPILLALSGRR